MQPQCILIVIILKRFNDGVLDKFNLIMIEIYSDKSAF